ncbi:glycerophosphodiester phosphodiesterase [Enhygromyxa salina]|uniref:Putative glycerophosphoryl diester phosphodiesterase 1 n=1 Tax=Enhygromyxa salina TaxID=215803 RepID=A0A2S9YPW0_9BACT|nr:glycerophosphodiester phosphodiesterase [Enhygromyxa salina]PRQ07131.1 putative glycerophosphoryl diester phosphodiesterase 1 [Enhygromyxa salina]
MPLPYFQSRGLACLAHRGGAASHPENTLEAFRAGLDAGCPWLETDLHMTCDGHIVCFHDALLQRTTNGHGELRQLTLAQLRRLDAGYHFTLDGHSYPFRGQGVTIPTLEEVVGLDAEVRVNLDIKQAKPPIVAALWQQIETLGIHDRVLVGSEDLVSLRAFRRLARGTVVTSACTAEVFAFWLAARAKLSARVPIDYDALQVPVSHGSLRVVTAEFVRAAHQRGLQVHVWTIDEPEQMRWLIRLGVDGIVTDHPRRLARLARELGVTPTTARTQP